MTTNAGAQAVTPDYDARCVTIDSSHTPLVHCPRILHHPSLIGHAWAGVSIASVVTTYNMDIQSAQNLASKA